LDRPSPPRAPGEGEPMPGESASAKRRRRRKRHGSKGSSQGPKPAAL
jgi:hypothetical protein